MTGDHAVPQGSMLGGVTVQSVRTNVGANLKRDALHVCLLGATGLDGKYENRTGTVVDSPSEVGNWPPLATGMSPEDSDADGIPDSAEPSPHTPDFRLEGQSPQPAARRGRRRSHESRGVPPIPRQAMMPANRCSKCLIRDILVVMTLPLALATTTRHLGFTIAACFIASGLHAQKNASSGSIFEEVRLDAITPEEFRDLYAQFDRQETSILILARQLVAQERDDLLAVMLSERPTLTVEGCILGMLREMDDSPFKDQLVSTILREKWSLDEPPLVSTGHGSRTR